jgi:hypothetical protein
MHIPTKRYVVIGRFTYVLSDRKMYLFKDENNFEYIISEIIRNYERGII